ncbi:MAG: hypothetical protein HYZ32_04895, partial [Hydrocarboniphaga effusa]|nr:hypothetical protein [Hydrocarboniphaga effusa]
MLKTSEGRGFSRRFSYILSGLALLAAAGVALAQFPFGRGIVTTAYDYFNYLFIGSGNCDQGGSSVNDLPAGWNCESQWKFTDHREPPGLTETYDPNVANNPQEFFGVKGAATNKAWEVSTGRPDTVIAVFDSGIRWEENRPELVNKYYLNRRELPVPAGGPNDADSRYDGYDVNGDGSFNVADYAGDGRVSDLNGNSMKDPEDLIRIFSDGIDADNNGYVDDISGWDFFEDDNNPQDDVDYGHGTGEAGDSSSEVVLDNGS